MVNVEKLMTEAEAQVKRLKAISETQKSIQKQREKLDADEAALMAEINNFGKKTRKSKTKVKAKGKDKPVPISKTKRARATSKTGETLMQVLLRVSPSSKEEAVNKDELVARLVAHGYVSASSDPKVVIGQALAKDGSIKSPERAKWQRSAKGDKVFAESQV